MDSSGFSDDCAFWVGRVLEPEETLGKTKANGRGGDGRWMRRNETTDEDDDARRLKKTTMDWIPSDRRRRRFRRSATSRRPRKRKTRPFRRSVPPPR